MRNDGAPTGLEIYSEAAAALAGGRPYSYIRCGDGEGHFLRFGGDDFSIRTLSWRLDFFFGTQDVSLRDIRRISLEMRDAFAKCDRLGINQRYTYDEICDKVASFPSDANGYAGLKYLYEYVAAENLGAKLISAHLPYTMLCDGDLYRLIERAERVVIVTGRKALGRMMTVVFGDKFDTIHLDEEFRFSNRHPQAKLALGGLLNRLATQIDQSVGPGVLVLIGAGPVGKGLCGQAVSKGGVVIDCGAIFDAMVGLNTRDYFSKNDGRWPQVKVLEENSTLLLTSENVIGTTNGDVTPLGILTGKQVVADAREYCQTVSDDEHPVEGLTGDALLAKARLLQNELKAIRGSRSFRTVVGLAKLRRKLLRM